MWRNTALPVRCFVLDARACFPVLGLCMYWSWTTFEIAIVGMAFFGVLSWLGLSIPIFLRLVRRMIVGPLRPTVPSWDRRRLA